MLITLLSNGHGEDAVGALLVEELLRQRPDWRVAAFPVVNEGRAYEGLGIDLLGPRRVMPSGGLLFHSRELLVRDLKAGFLSMTLVQVRDLRRLKTDALLVIGDVYALTLSSLVRAPHRFFVQTLVSARHTPEKLEAATLNRYFMERISVPERLLMRYTVKRVYTRDEATEVVLKALGLNHVVSLGNPMLDALSGSAMPAHRDSGSLLALLPGTRRYAPEALRLMLQALMHLPNTTALVAWAGGALPELPSWQREEPPPYEGLQTVLRHQEQRVFVYEGRFADILHSCEVALGTAGTANEQAAALGLAVVSFPVLPDYGTAFLRNQKRLLADALTLTAAEPRSIAGAVRYLLEKESRRVRAARLGRERMGAPGGTKAIIQDILKQLEG